MQAKVFFAFACLILIMEHGTWITYHHLSDMENNNFHKQLREKMDEYVHLIYRLTRDFPKEELYGVTAQIKRATLSVILNYIEGYARRRNKVYKNFLETSYGSLKESEYLLEFSKKEGFITNIDLFQKSLKLADEIGAMLWSTIEGMEKKNDNS